MRFFTPPVELVAEVYATIPDSLRETDSPSTWIDANHPGSRLGCFLEGVNIPIQSVKDGSDDLLHVSELAE